MRGTCGTTTELLGMLAPYQALCAFNVENFDTLTPVLRAAGRLDCPVVVALSVPAAQYLGYEYIVDLVRCTARQFGTIYALHLDHCENAEEAKSAVHAGFTSANLLNDGVFTDKEYVATAQDLRRQLGGAASWEFIFGLLGHAADSMHDDRLPQAATPKLADERDIAEFAAAVCPDILGFHCGSLHGMRDRGQEIDLKLIRRVASLTGLPIVLHGSSGVRQDHVLAGIDAGIRKINIETALRSVFMDTIRNNVLGNGAAARKPRYLTVATDNALAPTLEAFLTAYTLRQPDPTEHAREREYVSLQSNDTTYRAAGVDYDLLDASKRQAMAAAWGTSALAAARGGEVLDTSRGESAFVMRIEKAQLALVMECLGTKSRIAREYQDSTGVDRFDSIGYDTVAAIVNDLCSVGALPFVVNAYFATGSPKWYATAGRFTSLVNGFERACRDAGAVWGGGESPMLGGLIQDTEIDLAGCAIGRIPDDQAPLTGDRLRPGDEIVFIASTGLHTNGASLARRAATQGDGLEARLPDGRTFGDALLEPSAIYAPLIEAFYAAEVPLTYTSHVTGHGFRKIMRANRQLTYRVTDLPPVPEVFTFMIETLGLSTTEAYGTFNMGAGFVVFCPAGEGDRVVQVAQGHGHAAWVGGAVEQGPRSVILEPIDVVFTDAELQLR